MPNPIKVHAPDWIDVNTQLTAIGGDFGLLCQFTVTVERDYVVVVARCVPPGASDDYVPDAQALAKRPIKSRPDLAVMCFSVAQDCWRQLDSGNGAIGGTALSYGWNGRPNITRRST